VRPTCRRSNAELLPPSEEKIRSIAKQLGQNEDVFLALAGRVSPDIQQIIRKQPRHLAAFLRTADGLPTANIEQLTDEAARLKETCSNRPLSPRKAK
jgi:HTH-type transcriptional regulator, competence development regulator